MDEDAPPVRYRRRHNIDDVWLSADILDDAEKEARYADYVEADESEPMTREQYTTRVDADAAGIFAEMVGDNLGEEEPNVLEMLEASRSVAETVQWWKRLRPTAAEKRQEQEHGGGTSDEQYYRRCWEAVRNKKTRSGKLAWLQHILTYRRRADASFVKRSFVRDVNSVFRDVVAKYAATSNQLGGRRGPWLPLRPTPVVYLAKDRPHAPDEFALQGDDLHKGAVARGSKRTRVFDGENFGSNAYFMWGAGRYVSVAAVSPQEGGRDLSIRFVTTPLANVRFERSSMVSPAIEKATANAAFRDIAYFPAIMISEIIDGNPMMHDKTPMQPPTLADLAEMHLLLDSAYADHTVPPGAEPRWVGHDSAVAFMEDMVHKVLDAKFNPHGAPQPTDRVRGGANLVPPGMVELLNFIFSSPSHHLRRIWLPRSTFQPAAHRYYISLRVIFDMQLVPGFFAVRPTYEVLALLVGAIQNHRTVHRRPATRMSTFLDREAVLEILAADPQQASWYIRSFLIPGAVLGGLASDNVDGTRAFTFHNRTFPVLLIRTPYEKSGETRKLMLATCNMAASVPKNLEDTIRSGGGAALSYDASVDYNDTEALLRIMLHYSVIGQVPDVLGQEMIAAYKSQVDNFVALSSVAIQQRGDGSGDGDVAFVTYPGAQFMAHSCVPAATFTQFTVDWATRKPALLDPVVPNTDNIYPYAPIPYDASVTFGPVAVTQIPPTPVCAVDVILSKCTVEADLSRYAGLMFVLHLQDDERDDRGVYLGEEKGIYPLPLNILSNSRVHRRHFYDFIRVPALWDHYYDRNVLVTSRVKDMLPRLRRLGTRGGRVPNISWNVIWMITPVNAIHYDLEDTSNPQVVWTEQTRGLLPGKRFRAKYATTLSQGFDVGTGELRDQALYHLMSRDDAVRSDAFDRRLRTWWRTFTEENDNTGGTGITIAKALYRHWWWTPVMRGYLPIDNSVESRERLFQGLKEEMPHLTDTDDGVRVAFGTRGGESYRILERTGDRMLKRFFKMYDRIEHSELYEQCTYPIEWFDDRNGDIVSDRVTVTLNRHYNNVMDAGARLASSSYSFWPLPHANFLRERVVIPMLRRAAITDVQRQAIEDFLRLGKYYTRAFGGGDLDLAQLEEQERERVREIALREEELAIEAETAEYDARSPYRGMSLAELDIWDIPEEMGSPPAVASSAGRAPTPPAVASSAASAAARGTTPPSLAPAAMSPAPASPPQLAEQPASPFGGASMSPPPASPFGGASMSPPPAFPEAEEEEEEEEPETAVSPQFAGIQFAQVPQSPPTLAAPGTPLPPAPAAVTQMVRTPTPPEAPARRERDFNWRQVPGRAGTQGLPPATQPAPRTRPPTRATAPPPARQAQREEEEEAEEEAEHAAHVDEGNMMMVDEQPPRDLSPPLMRLPETSQEEEEEEEELEEEIDAGSMFGGGGEATDEFMAYASPMPSLGLTPAQAQVPPPTLGALSPVAAGPSEPLEMPEHFEHLEPLAQPALEPVGDDVIVQLRDLRAKYDNFKQTLSQHHESGSIRDLVRELIEADSDDSDKGDVDRATWFLRALPTLSQALRDAYVGSSDKYTSKDGTLTRTGLLRYIDGGLGLAVLAGYQARVSGASVTTAMDYVSSTVRKWIGGGVSKATVDRLQREFSSDTGLLNAVVYDESLMMNVAVAVPSEFVRPPAQRPQRVVEATEFALLRRDHVGTPSQDFNLATVSELKSNVVSPDGGQTIYTYVTS